MTIVPHSFSFLGNTTDDFITLITCSFSFFINGFLSFTKVSYLSG